MDSSLETAAVEKIFLPRRLLRKQSGAADLESLAASIRTHGLIQPIVVRRTPSGYEIVAGIRRYLACRKAGLKTIPVIVRDVTEGEATTLNIVENTQRSGFSPVEQAEMLKNAANPASREELARLLGMTPSAAALAERITSMSMILKEAISMRVITPEMAVELARISNSQMLLDAIGRIHRESLSLKEVKLLVDTAARAVPTPVDRTRRPKAAPLVARVRLLLRKLSRQEKLDFDLLRSVASELMRGLAEESPWPFLDLAYRESRGSFLPRHALNVAKLALFLGKHYGYGDADLELLAGAALLSDVGMSRIPSSIVRKPGVLTPRELEEVRRHTERGTMILKKETLLWEAIARTAYEHHEKVDGSGYPRGLKVDEIHTFAKIINIVDTFEAMISPRPHRQPLPPREAMRHLVAEAEKGAVDKGVMRVFVRCMSMHPIGSHVRLSTGGTGLVIDANPSDAERPVVRLLGETPTVIDLASAENREVTIDILSDRA